MAVTHEPVYQPGAMFDQLPVPMIHERSARFGGT
jgi:hypothetical protein